MKEFLKDLISRLPLPSINMKNDYQLVRKLQRLAAKLMAPFTKQKIEAYVDTDLQNKEEGASVPARIFYPEEELSDQTILFIHGGGWVIGDVDSYSTACVNLANRLGRKVYSLEYRLAPEHPFPAGFDDCYAAVDLLLNPVLENSFRQWILMGDSAGGNLAAAISQKLRDQGRNLPDKQILLYPVTYWDHSEASPFESIRTNAEGHGLTSKRVQEYMDLYEPDPTKRKNPYISPLLAKDLSQQPATLVITAEFDPLRDEGEAYGQALAHAGNQVEIHRISDSVHGFLTYPSFAQPLVEAYDLMEDFLAERKY